MQVCAIVCKQQISAIVCKLLQDFANSKFCKVMQSFAVVYKQQVFAIVCKQKDCASLQVGCLENINMGPKGNLMNFYFPILMRFSKFDNHFFLQEHCIYRKKILNKQTSSSIRYTKVSLWALGLYTNELL